MRCLRIQRSRSLTAAALIAASLPIAIVAQDELPEGAGRDTVKRICSDCHEISTVTGARRTRLGWQQTVDDMVSRGAQGSDDDMAAVVAYLTEWFGKINVNTATAAELQKVLGFSEKEARAMVSYREQNGKIKSFDEL